MYLLLLSTALRRPDEARAVRIPGTFVGRGSTAEQRAFTTASAQCEREAAHTAIVLSWHARSSAAYIVVTYLLSAGDPKTLISTFQIFPYFSSLYMYTYTYRIFALNREGGGAQQVHARGGRGNPEPGMHSSGRERCFKGVLPTVYTSVVYY